MAKKDHKSIPDQNPSRLILEALKRIARRRGLRQVDLARAMEVSLPTVKRLFASPDVPLSRLSRLCQILGLELRDIWQLIETEEPRVHRFKSREEDYFAAHPSCLAYFFELQKGKSPARIAQENSLSNRDTRAFLLPLEKMKLVIRESGDRVRILVRGSIVWDDAGPLGRGFSREMILQMADRAVTNLGKNGDLFTSLSVRGLTSGNYDELKVEMEKLVDKYRRISTWNRETIQESRLKPYSLVILADAWDPEVFSRVRRPRST